MWHKETAGYYLITLVPSLILIIIQLLYAIVVSKDIQHLYVPRTYSFVGSLLCFDFITKKQRSYRAVVATSLWLLMGFFQQWASAVVPVIILLMISFIRTISTVAIFTSLFVFLVMLAASVAHNFHRLTEKRISCLHALIEIAAVCILVGCVVCSLSVFWYLVLEGFSADSFSDLVWSLGLPALLSGGAIYMKKFILKGVASDSDVVGIMKEVKEDVTVKNVSHSNIFTLF